MKKVYLFKVKEGKLDTWKEWSEYLNSHKKEVLETLRKEELSFEACDLFKEKEEYFVVGRAIGNFKAVDLDNKININHRKKIKECLEPIESMQNLYHFET